MLQSQVRHQKMRTAVLHLIGGLSQTKKLPPDSCFLFDSATFSIFSSRLTGVTIFFGVIACRLLHAHVMRESTGGLAGVRRGSAGVLPRLFSPAFCQLFARFLPVGCDRLADFNQHRSKMQAAEQSENGSEDNITGAQEQGAGGEVSHYCRK